MNRALLEERKQRNAQIQVDIVKIEEVELDEMWSFIGKKSNQRWLWHAIDHNTHEVLAYHFGKRHTQAIERKHLILRTRINHLGRKTICFSKREKMHDIVIGLFINRYEFGLVI